MMEKRKYKLSDYCLHITDGEHASVDDDIQGDYFLLSNKNIIDGNIIIDKNDRKINEATFDKINKRILLEENDVIISTVGTLGKTAVITGDINYTFQRSVGIIKPNPQILDSFYLKYLLDTDYYQRLLVDLSSGAIQKCIFISTLKTLPISLPPLPVQQKVASVLSSLDKKIALNKQINQNLEALARQLYDYWFVQFDFPNEEGKPYKSSSGKMVYNPILKREIPEGWEVMSLGDVTEIYNGSTPTSTNEAYYNGDIVWITPKDLSMQKEKFIYYGERTITQEGYDSCSTHLLPINSILMSSRAPIGLIAIAKTELCTNQGFKSFVPKISNLHTYLYYYLQQHMQQIEKLGTGTTFKEVSREEISRYKVLIPSTEVLMSYETKIVSTNEMQFNIQKEIDVLTKQRDELLPLLMNGQVNFDLLVWIVIFARK